VCCTFVIVEQSSSDISSWYVAFFFLERSDFVFSVDFFHVRFIVSSKESSSHSSEIVL